MGEFNSFNLLQANDWIKLTDANVVINQWKELEYARIFNELSSRKAEVEAWQDGIEDLSQEVYKLTNLQAHNFIKCDHQSPNGIIIAQM